MAVLVIQPDHFVVFVVDLNLWGVKQKISSSTSGSVGKKIVFDNIFLHINHCVKDRLVILMPRICHALSMCQVLGTFWAQSAFLACFSLWMYFWTQKVFVHRQFLSDADGSVQSHAVISEELDLPKLVERKNNLRSTITLLLLSWTFIWGMEIDGEEVSKQFKWKEGIDKVIALWQRQPVESVIDVVWWVCIALYLIQQAPLHLNVKDIIESFSWLLFIIRNVRTSDCMCKASNLSISKTPPCLVFLSGGPLQWEFTSCCSSGQQVWPAASWHVPQVAQTGELLQGIRLRRLVWNLCKGKMLQWSIFLLLPLLIQILLNM